MLVFKKTQWTNTSRWHCTPNHHRLWKLNTGLHATWAMSFSTLPPQGSQNFKIPGSPSGRYSSDFGSPKISLTSPNKKKTINVNQKHFQYTNIKERVLFYYLQAMFPLILFLAEQNFSLLGGHFRHLSKNILYTRPVQHTRTHKKVWNFNVLFIFDLTLDVTKWCTF